MTATIAHRSRPSAFLVAALVAAVLCCACGVAQAYYYEGVDTGKTPGEFAAAITVDGLLDDWAPAAAGSTPASWDLPNSDWIPTIAGVCYWVEDGVGCNGRVGPGRGGQNFDHEAGYIGSGANALNIALVTGMDQDGQKISYRNWTDPGDVFFDVNGDDKWDFAVATHDHGSVEEGKAYAPKPEYEEGNWWTTPGYSDSSPARIRSSRVDELFDLGSMFIYTNATTVDDYRHPGQAYSALDHNVIEFSIPWEELAAYTINSVRLHFTQTCGNDVTDFTCDEPFEPGESVPEPTTLALTLASFAALAGIRRRRKKA